MQINNFSWNLSHNLESAKFPVFKCSNAIKHDITNEPNSLDHSLANSVQLITSLHFSDAILIFPSTGLFSSSFSTPLSPTHLILPIQVKAPGVFWRCNLLYSTSCLQSQGPYFLISFVWVVLSSRHQSAIFDPSACADLI